MQQPDLEKPYIEQGSYEVLVETLSDRNFEDVWSRFTDEIEVERAIHQYDPEDMLRDIIQMVAFNRAKKKTPQEAYSSITDMVNEFVGMIANRETIKDLENR